MVDAPPSTTADMVPEYIVKPSLRPATRYSLLLVARRMPHQPMPIMPST